MGLAVMKSIAHCLYILSISLHTLAPLISAKCHDPSPAFPLPDLDAKDPILKNTFDYISLSLNDLVSSPTDNKTSFSVSITSSKQTLYSHHHTARDRGTSPRGVSKVDGDSRFRIASISKVFTVLGVLYQHAAGNLSLDDPVGMYLEVFNQAYEDRQKGKLPWHSITIRALASQLSGIPREVLQEDLINDPTLAQGLGLPPASREGLPKCDEYNNYKNSCSPSTFFHQLHKQEPLFAPNQKSTYSNDAFSILGLVLANVTGTGDYSEYIRTAIFETLGMNHTTLEKPAEKTVVIPDVSNHWDFDLGVQRPTGGIYSSSNDLSIFLRYVLTHYNAITPALNWLNPVSYADSMNSFFGMPWEIFRTDKILPSTRRPVTFVTKAGAYYGYTSLIIVVPEHDIGLTILVADDTKFLSKTRDLITIPLIRTIDKLAMNQLDTYTGTYTYIPTPTSSSSSTSTPCNPKLNTTLILSRHLHNGLHLTNFISNNTDVLSFLGGTSRQRFQLSPTLLYVDEKNQSGERWRVIIVDAEPPDVGVVWEDGACITDVDGSNSYAGRPLNEIVFWRGEDGEVEEVELTAYGVRLRRVEEGEGGRNGDEVKEDGDVLGDEL